MDGSCYWLLEYAFELSSYGSLVSGFVGRCGFDIEIILPEVARCMNYFLSLCRDFPWTTHWSLFAVFCFLSWLVVPIQFLLRFWSFDIFRMFWMVLFWIFILSLISRIVRMKG